MITSRTTMGELEALLKLHNITIKSIRFVAAWPAGRGVKIHAIHQGTRHIEVEGSTLEGVFSAVVATFVQWKQFSSGEIHVR